MSTSLEMKRRHAFSMSCRGLSVGEIAHVLGVTEATIKNYLKESRTEAALVSKKIDREDYVGLVMARHEAVRSEAWAGWRRAGRESDKRGYLNTIAKLEKQEVDVLTELGMIEREGKNVEADINITAIIRSEIGRADLHAMAFSLLSGRMGITPQEALELQPDRRRHMVLPVSHPGRTDAKEIEGEIYDIVPVVDVEHEDEVALLEQQEEIEK